MPFLPRAGSVCVPVTAQPRNSLSASLAARRRWPAGNAGPHPSAAPTYSCEHRARPTVYARQRDINAIRHAPSCCDEWRLETVDQSTPCQV